MPSLIVQKTSGRQQSIWLLRMATALVFGAFLIVAGSFSTAQENKYFDGVLESPGGPLKFRFDVHFTKGKPSAEINWGNEIIPIEEFQLTERKMTLGFPHYDSRITAKYDPTTKSYVGEWRKTVGKSKTCVMKFSAIQVPITTHSRLYTPPKFSISGRWAVHFAKSDDPAVGVFKVSDGSGTATGTFMTTTGDYRFLGGTFRNNQLELSCFDGAHAFLFKAKLQKDKSLKGTFWSRDSWTENWTATKKEDAKLPDAFQMTKWQSNVPFSKMKFPDLDGKIRSLGDKDLAGEKATLIYVFGSWCPNCHDAGKLVAQLEKDYASKGLKVIGVAFELTGDDKRDAKQVKTYLKKNGTQFPVLLVGTSNKSEASKRFTIIDKIRSYPTTIFVDGKGEVKKIHTGFSGPATGDSHKELIREFRKTIEGMLRSEESR